MDRLYKILTSLTYIFLVVLGISILLLDVATAYFYFSGRELSGEVVLKMTILNLLLVLFLGGYIIFKKFPPSDKFMFDFFRFPPKEEPFNFNTLFDFISLVFVGMVFASLIKLWAPEFQSVFGVILSSIIAFTIYIIACLFTGIGISKLAWVLAKYRGIIYWPSIIIASLFAFFVFGAGFDMVQ